MSIGHALFPSFLGSVVVMPARSICTLRLRSIISETVKPDRRSSVSVRQPGLCVQVGALQGDPIQDCRTRPRLRAECRRLPSGFSSAIYSVDPSAKLPLMVPSLFMSQTPCWYPAATSTRNCPLVPDGTDFNGVMSRGLMPQ